MTKISFPLIVPQELFALGASFFISSFFQVFPGTQAPPRSLVQESAGGKTQVAGLFSCVLVLLVCLVMGPALQVGWDIITGALCLSLNEVIMAQFKRGHYVSV